MKRILITGMSGTGKSTVIERLASMGQKAVDLDDDYWCEQTMVPVMDDPSGDAMERAQVWQEDRVHRLLDTEDAEVLFIAGCESNQGKFYERLDRVVLLTAPIHVILHRIAARTTNPYGKTPEERERILLHIRTVEPLLRASSDLEIDTSLAPPDTVAETVLAAARDA